MSIIGLGGGLPGNEAVQAERARPGGGDGWTYAGRGWRRPKLLTLLRVVLFTFLLFTSASLLYATGLFTGNVRYLAGKALESTALALSASAESALRSNGNRFDEEIRDILSDRVVAYALIAGRDGMILFHTNPALVGVRLPATATGGWPSNGRFDGRRIRLGTGPPAYEFDYVLQRPDGKPELLRLVLNTGDADLLVAEARNMWGTVGGVLLLLWGIGISLERVLAHRLRLQSELDRRERLALIGRMTATLAHEIRNALGSVKGYTQWVDEKVEPGDPRKRGLELALQGTARIEELVNDLLLFSREETYRCTPTDLATLARETAAATGAWGGTTKLDLSPGILAMADPEKITRVLLNGLRNALQAMGETGTLGIAVRREDRWAALRIEDSGPGIPESEFPRLFTPFHTTKADGTGLGLAYSKKVVEGMGGVIELSNRQEGGAVLLIRLPCAR